MVERVAINTTGGPRGAQLVTHAVNAVDVLLVLRLVALAAIDRLCRQIVIGMFYRKVGMATGAGIGFVDGGAELGFVNKKPEGLAGGIGLEESLVGVAFEARTIWDGRVVGALKLWLGGYGSVQRANEHYDDPEQRQYSLTHMGKHRRRVEILLRVLWLRLRIICDLEDGFSAFLILMIARVTLELALRKEFDYLLPKNSVAKYSQSLF